MRMKHITRILCILQITAYKIMSQHVEFKKESKQ